MTYIIDNKKNRYTNLEDKEINKIESVYNDKNVKDITLKQRQYNIEKLQKFFKVIHKNKKNKHKRHTFKKNNEYIFHPDPFKFKQIPSNIKQTILDFVHNHNTSLSYVAYKCKLPVYKLNRYIYQNYPIDNYDLNKVLLYFNYNLNEHL